ncbi:FAD-dependent oxidoreductase [Cystobacter fuscus]
MSEAMIEHVRAGQEGAPLARIPSASRHRILIIGGGTAGISVAARLARAGQKDVAIIEPSAQHYYQPLWTLVGAGEARVEDTVRDEARLIPKGVKWIQDWARDVDPVARKVSTRGASRLAMTSSWWRRASSSTGTRCAGCARRSRLDPTSPATTRRATPPRRGTCCAPSRGAPPSSPTPPRR